MQTIRTIKQKPIFFRKKLVIKVVSNVEGGFTVADKLSNASMLVPEDISHKFTVGCFCNITGYKWSENSLHISNNTRVSRCPIITIIMKLIDDAINSAGRAQDKRPLSCSNCDLSL